MLCKVTVCIKPKRQIAYSRLLPQAQIKLRKFNVLLNDVRCKNCGKLLGKGDVSYFEMKCPRCKKINVLKTTSFNLDCQEQLVEKFYEKRTNG